MNTITGQQRTLKKHVTLISSTSEPAIQSCDIGQWIPITRLSIDHDMDVQYQVDTICLCFEVLTLGGTRGGGGRGGAGCHLHKVFLIFFFLENKTSVPDVFSSCSFIPCAHFEISLVMVSCYDYEI